MDKITIDEKQRRALTELQNEFKRLIRKKANIELQHGQVLNEMQAVGFSVDQIFYEVCAEHNLVPAEWEMDKDGDLIPRQPEVAAQPIEESRPSNLIQLPSLSGA